MTKKVHVHPGVWIFLIAIAMMGIFFGIKALQESDSWGAVVSDDQQKIIENTNSNFKILY